MEFEAMVELFQCILMSFLTKSTLNLQIDLSFSQAKMLNIYFIDIMIFFISRSLPSVLVRHSKITENKLVLEELQNTSWQYLVDSVIIATKSKKYLKTTTKREAETMKDTKKMQNITESLQLYIFKHC